MKYAVKRFSVKVPLSELGGSAWMSHIKQGGITEVEFDDTTRLLTLLGTADKIRVPVENVQSMVLGVTKASNRE